jgi:hypothetical protein
MTEHNQTVSAEIPPPVAMFQLIAGFWVSRTLYIAAKLGIADLLKDQAKSSEELAQATGTHAPSLYRVLRALASVGVFAEVEDGRFRLTPVGECLRTGVPGSMRALATMLCGQWRAWEDALYSVETGKIAFDHVFGMGLYQYLAQNPEAGTNFAEAMTEYTTPVAALVAAAYDFSPIGKLIDVGGGHGTLITAILKAHPTLTGVLFDVPPVAEGARQRIEAAGVAGRCELVGGSFFESVPGGGDAYLLANVILDYDDDRALKILKNCHRAMAGRGKLLLVESVISPGNEASFSKLVDVLMLVITGGRGRTEAEFHALLAVAGFRLTQIIPTPSEMSVIEAMPA